MKIYGSAILGQFICSSYRKLLVFLISQSILLIIYIMEGTGGLLLLPIWILLYVFSIKSDMIARQLTNQQKY